jgi:hypothetical protein
MQIKATSALNKGKETSGTFFKRKKKNQEQTHTLKAMVT